ncbi:MAG: hypothetical protein HC893_09180 [Chloroflexaceae bacterium]|nr:hypothetical protein [Chloroflexaceae bacterium]
MSDEVPQLTEQQTKRVAGDSRPPVMFQRLFQRSRAAAAAGDLAGARALLRALTHQYPDQIEGWRERAALAETASERVYALGWVHNLEQPAAPPSSQMPWRLLVITSVIVSLLVVIIQAAILGIEQGQVQQVVESAASIPSSRPLDATELAQMFEMPTPTVTDWHPQPSPVPAGHLHTYGLWQGTLLQNDHARVLDEVPIGITTTGRLIVALVSVGNLTSEPRQMPADLFALVDDQGAITSRFWSIHALPEPVWTRHRRRSCL